MTMHQSSAIKPVADTNNTRSNNVGNEVRLLGSRPDDTGTPVRVDDDDPKQVPWLLSVSCKITTTSTTGVLTPIIQGFFGVGGTAHTFECDTNPDSILTLPGTTAQVKVVWDTLALYTTAAVPGDPDTVTHVRAIGGSNLLPDLAVVKAGVKHGSPVTPNATRTLEFSAIGGPAHILRFTLPAFSNTMFLYLGTDGSYANVTSLTFAQSFAAPGPLVTYSGAQLLAFKNAGIPVPIPGGATVCTLTLTANGGGFLSFNLNL